MNLLSQAIANAISPALVTGVLKLNRQPGNLTVQANFTYGSGGATVDLYLQTSLDGGLTWTDIANFHFTTASARQIVNLSARTTVLPTLTPTDGSMAANTAQDGVLGAQFRGKYQSSGTYAASTITFDIACDQLS